MSLGRPRGPNDPTVLSSVETALTTPRHGIAGRLWWWRYELALTLGLSGAAAAIAVALGPGWLIGSSVACVLLLGAAILRPPSRAWLVKRAWCVVTPHRIRSGCAQAWVQSRDGRLPVVLWTSPTNCGERVLLWCRAGITVEDLRAARDILAAACWATDVRVYVHARHKHLVTLEVIRRAPAAGAVPPTWPFLPQQDTEGHDTEEPARSLTMAS